MPEWIKLKSPQNEIQFVFTFSERDNLNDDKKYLVIILNLCVIKDKLQMSPF